MNEINPDPLRRKAMKSHELRGLAERYAQARRLTFSDVEIIDEANRLIDLGYGNVAWHADMGHWDSGHADAGFHDGHYDLHGDMPHWDHGDEGGHSDDFSDDSHDDDSHDDDADFLRDPWEVLINEQRYVLELTRQMTARFEQRLTALEQIVARQIRSD
jgi:hypothetical protein